MTWEWIVFFQFLGEIRKWASIARKGGKTTGLKQQKKEQKSHKKPVHKFRLPKQSVKQRIHVNRMFPMGNTKYFWPPFLHFIFFEYIFYCTYKEERGLCSAAEQYRLIIILFNWLFAVLFQINNNSPINISPKTSTWLFKKENGFNICYRRKDTIAGHSSVLWSLFQSKTVSR